MSFASTSDRVDRLETLFGQFLTEMAGINKRAEERHRAAEERHKAAEERHKVAEERHNAAEERAEARNKVAEERHKAAEERNSAAEERFSRFQSEMRDFKEEMRESKKEMNKKWGDLSNRLGTIAEDIFAPNLPRLATEHFKYSEVYDLIIRRERRNPKSYEQWQEFDAIAVGADSVILGDAKSSPSVDHADRFAEKLKLFFDFFPELDGRRLVPIFGSWSIHPSVKKRLTELQIYSMEMGDDTMDLTNADVLDPIYVAK